MIVYLIGHRCVGKSTAAPLVAERVRFPCIDLDREIERRSGKSIAEIFAESGERTFRDFESAELRAVAALNDAVVATGGGLVLREANREVLRHGRCVWLRASLETIVERLAKDDVRPALTTLGAVEETRDLLAVRTPIYASLAEFVVDVDGLTPQVIAVAIADHIKGRPA